jgi:hypothetical protein
LDSLALAIPAFHSKNKLLTQKNINERLKSSNVTILKQGSIHENDSGKSDTIVRASHLPSEQVQKGAIIPYVGKKRSRIENEPTGIMALVCHEKSEQDIVVSQPKRTRSSPRKSESTWSSRLRDERRSGTFGISSQDKSNLDQLHNSPRKSIPRKSIRYELVHQTSRDSERYDNDDIEFEINGDSASSTQANELTTEQDVSSKVITPSPKRKYVRKSVKQDGRNILNDMNSSVESNSTHINIKPNEGSTRRKKRVSRFRNKRLTLALTKSVTVGKRTVPSRAMVTPDLRPVAHGDKEGPNSDVFAIEKNGKIAVIKPKRGRKEKFIGIPPSEASSMGKNENNALDTIEELSRRVEENRKNAQIGIKLHFEKSPSFSETQVNEGFSKNNLQDERCVRDFVSYMDQMILQIEELKERVQKSAGADLISINKLKKKFRLPTENDLFIGNANTNVSKNSRDAKRKINIRNGKNDTRASELEAASSSPLSRSKRNHFTYGDCSNEDEMTRVHERENRIMIDCSDSDDSSIASNASVEIEGSELSKERPPERRAALLQRNDTLAHVGIGNDSIDQISKTAISSVVTVSLQNRKRPESKLTPKPCKKIISSFLDGIDHNELLERRWREEEARALIVTEREREIPENDSDSDSNSEVSLSLFL